MDLTKEITNDKIEVVGDFKFVQVRTATIVKEDGKELSRSFKRKVWVPGQLQDGTTNYVIQILVLPMLMFKLYEMHLGLKQ